MTWQPPYSINRVPSDRIPLSTQSHPTTTNKGTTTMKSVEEVVTQELRNSGWSNEEINELVDKVNEETYESWDRMSVKVDVEITYVVEYMVKLTDVEVEDADNVQESEIAEAMGEIYMEDYDFQSDFYDRDVKSCDVTEVSK